MELLDRYLNFVRLWLPRGMQQDIIDELSEDLHAQIADREAELGRPLQTGELEALLKQCGHPLLVAGRYLPQQQLIGQPFFPLYLFGLKAVQWVLFPLLLVAGSLAALFRAHPVSDLIGSIFAAFGGAIYIVGVLTVTFILLERVQAKLTFLQDWMPSDLPKMPLVPDPMQIPRSASFGSFIGCLAFCLWWSDGLRLLPVPQLQFLNPLPVGFFWPVLLLFAAEMALHAVNFFMPWWTRPRAALRLAFDVYGVALGAALLRTWPWFRLNMQGVSVAKLAQAELIANGALSLCILVVALGYGLRGLQDLRRARGLPPFVNPLVFWFGGRRAESRS